MCGVVGLIREVVCMLLANLFVCVSGTGLGWSTGVGESPVRENACWLVVFVPE